MNVDSNKKKGSFNFTPIIGGLIWGFSVIFYLYECFLRVFPNTIASELMESFDINAERFAMIGSGYFITYALLQPVVGYVINTFGPRKLLTLGALFCTLGVFWFSMATGLISAIGGRLLMGFGSSVALLCVLTLALNWFDQKHFGFFSGLSQFLGSIGPLLAGAPLAFFMKKAGGDWKLIFFYLGLFALILTILIPIIIRNKPRNKDQIIFLQREEPRKTSLLTPLKNFRIWLIITQSCLIYASMAALGTFWGTLYLQSKGLDRYNAAFITSMIWIGYACAAPLLGKLSDRVKRRNPILISCAILGLICSFSILYFPIETKFILILLFIGIGVASSSQSLTYPLIVETVHQEHKSSIMGLLNMFVMLSAAIIPTIIGAIIHNDDLAVNGNSIPYTTADYERGLFLMPVIFLISLLIATFGIKETFCRPRYEVHHLKNSKT